MEKKLKKTNYIIEIAIYWLIQDLWQAHYQKLLITLLKQFIKLNVKMSILIKIVKCVELIAKIVSTFLKYTNFEDDVIECKYLFCNNGYQEKFLKVWWKLKETRLPICMLKKNSVKFDYLQRKLLQSPKHRRNYSYRLCAHQ